MPSDDSLTGLRDGRLAQLSAPRHKSRLSSEDRVVAVVVALFLVVYYAAMLLLLFFPGIPQQPSPPSSLNTLSSPLPAHGKAFPVEERALAPRETATPRDPRREIFGAPEPQISSGAPPLRSAAGRPIPVSFSAPTKVADGNTFQVSIGVSPGSGVHSAKFRLSYDDDALELMDMTDVTGTTLPLSPSEPGSVELNLDGGRGAGDAASIRFLARTGTSRAVQIAVAVELRDQSGNALPGAALDPRSIIVGP